MRTLFRLFLVLVSVLAGVSAHAALPPSIFSAITAAGADLVSAIVAIISAFVVFWGLNKLATKLGWGGVPQVGERYAYYDNDGRLTEAVWSRKDDGIHKRRHGS